MWIVELDAPTQSFKQRCIHGVRKTWIPEQEKLRPHVQINTNTNVQEIIF